MYCLLRKTNYDRYSLYTERQCTDTALNRAKGVCQNIKSQYKA